MGRLSTSIFAISAFLAIVDVDCCRLYALEESFTQEGNESQIVAPNSTDATDSSNQDGQPSTVGSSETKVEGFSEPSDSTKASVVSAPQGDINSDGLSASTKTPSPANTSFSEAFFSNPLNLVLLVFLALYILLLFLPKQAKKEQKALQARLANLKKNDRVILNSGIHGVVANVNSDAGTVTLRVDESSNAKITVDRNAIRSVEA